MAPFRVISGFFLLLLGLAGLLLPVLPGWVFIFGGLALLSRHFHWARRLTVSVRLLYRRLRRRSPAAAATSAPSGPGS